MKQHRRHKMGKRSRANKRRAFLASSNGDVPGGVIGAMFRNSNGSATPADIGFLARMAREAKGKDGYTGMDKSKFTQPTDSRFTFYQQDKEVFHCAEAAEITSKCPLNPDVPAILIPITMWECFLACCKEYNTEWIALLIGKMDKDAANKPAYVIDRFYFPPQTAGPASVDVPTGVKPKPGTIGAIHSHVGMGVFWSGTDTSHSNWPVEIVINRKEQYESLSRYQLKCGEWAKGKSEVRLTGSYVSKAIDNQVQAAFASGTMLDKENKARLPVVVHTPPTPVTSPVPSTTAITTFDSPTCIACNHYSHKKGEKCPAMDCKCDASTYLEAYNRKEEEKCPHPLCVRPKEHAGYHRTAQEEYFQFAPKAIDAKQSQIEWPHSEQLTEQASDDSPLGDLPSEEYCPRCEGYSCVEVQGQDGRMVVVDCPYCKGTGLSELGKLRAAEAMLN